MGTMDIRGTWRRPAKPWKTGTKAHRAAAEPDGIPRKTNRRELLPQIPFCRTLGTLGPLVFSFPPPFANTRRFGDFETPVIGWLTEYRGDG